MVIHDTEVRYRTFLVVDNVGSNGSTNKSTGRTMPPYRYSARYGHKLMPLATITHQLPGVWRIIYHTNEHGFRTGMPPSRMYMIDQILSLSVTRIPLVWEPLTVRNSARCSTMPLEQKQALSTWACLVGGSQARYEHTMSLVAFFRPEDCHSAV